jgi:hypothetical protein
MMKFLKQISPLIWTYEAQSEIASNYLYLLRLRITGFMDFVHRLEFLTNSVILDVIYRNPSGEP